MVDTRFDLGIDSRIVRQSGVLGACDQGKLLFMLTANRAFLADVAAQVRFLCGWSQPETKRPGLALLGVFDEQGVERML